MIFAARSVAPPCFSSSLPHTTMPHHVLPCLNSTLSLLSLSTTASTLPCLYSLSALLPQLYSVSTLLSLNSTLSLLTLSPTASTLLCLNSALSQLYPVSTIRFKFYSLSQPYCLNSTLSELCSVSTLPCLIIPQYQIVKIRTNNSNVIITPSSEQATYICTKD